MNRWPRTSSLLVIGTLFACEPVSPTTEVAVNDEGGVARDDTIAGGRRDDIDPPGPSGTGSTGYDRLQLRNGFLQGDIGPVLGINAPVTDLVLSESGLHNRVELTVDLDGHLAMTVINLVGNLRSQAFAPGAHLEFPSAIGALTNAGGSQPVGATVWGCTGEYYAGDEYDEPADVVILDVSSTPTTDTRVFTFTARWFGWSAGSSQGREVHGHFEAVLPSANSTPQDNLYDDAVAMTADRLVGHVGTMKLDEAVSLVQGSYDGPFQRLELGAGNEQGALRVVVTSTFGLVNEGWRQNVPITYTAATDGPDAPRLVAFVSDGSGWTFADSADELVLTVLGGNENALRYEFRGSWQRPAADGQPMFVSGVFSAEL